MRLTTTGTAILAGTVRIAEMDPRRAQAVMIATGFRPAVAAEAAYGELSSEAARRLGRTAGLITKE